jgi:hypothetical protein
MKWYREVKILGERAAILCSTYFAYLVIDSRSMKNVLAGNFQSSFYFATPKLYVYKLSSIVYIIMCIRTQTSLIKIASPISTTFWSRLFFFDHYSKRMSDKNSTPEAFMHFSLGTDSLITTQTKKIPAKLERKCYDIFLLHENQ